VPRHEIGEQFRLLLFVDPDEAEAVDSNQMWTRTKTRSQKGAFTEKRTVNSAMMVLSGARTP
jgi:hypothetical protein